MRVSTSNFYDSSSTQLNNLQSQITDLSSQISTGKKNITPQDDPSVSVQILNLNQSTGTDAQLVQNRTTLRNSLGTSNAALTSMQDLLQSMNEQAISGRTGTLSATDQATIANTLNQQLQQLVTLANSTDGSGHYIFAGTNTSSPPIANGSSAQLTLSSGSSVSYQQFTYQGNSNSLNIQILPGKIDPNNPSLNSAGMAANAGDILGVTSSSSGFLGLVSKAIAVMQSPTHTQDDVSNALNDVSNAFSVSYTKVLNNLSVIGLTQNNLDSIDQMAVNKSTQDSKTLSALQDTDYNKALSQLSQQQLELQAAQKSFQQISSLSLFNYIQ